jgi:hypothetical protein
MVASTIIVDATRVKEIICSLRRCALDHSKKLRKSKSAISLLDGYGGDVLRSGCHPSKIRF